MPTSTRARSLLLNSIKEKYDVKGRAELSHSIGRRWHHATDAQMRQWLGIKPPAKKSAKPKLTAKRYEAAKQSRAIALAIKQKLGLNDEAVGKVEAALRKNVKIAVDKARRKGADDKGMRAAALSAIQTTIREVKGRGTKEVLRGKNPAQTLRPEVKARKTTSGKERSSTTPPKTRSGLERHRIELEPLPYLPEYLKGAQVSPKLKQQAEKIEAEIRDISHRNAKALVEHGRQMFEPFRQRIESEGQKREAKLRETEKKFKRLDDMLDSPRERIPPGVVDSYIQTKRQLQELKDEQKDAATGVMQQFRRGLLKRPLVSDSQIRALMAEASFSASDPVEGGLPNSYSRAKFEKDIAEFHRLTGGAAKTIKLWQKTGDRACADPNAGAVNIGSKSDQGELRTALFHEMGHHVEFSNEAIGRAARAWIESRATGEAKPLSQLNPDSKYNSDEVALPDHFVHPYVGKLYTPRLTEVLSVGLQFFHDPKLMEAFHRKDPEHFYFVLGAIHVK